ncbi:MAG TPA: hypothetical protein VGJ48_17780 [Pyrinomonadaceae bacterium]|jgi:hypothetical protein
MIYEKPEVLEIGKPEDVIHGLGKGVPQVDTDDRNSLAVLHEEVDEANSVCS